MKKDYFIIPMRFLCDSKFSEFRNQINYKLRKNNDFHLFISFIYISLYNNLY